MWIKDNVSMFNADISEISAYRYTDSSVSVSRLFSNTRTSDAIRHAADFTKKKIIDVGCGDGIFTLEFPRLGASSVIGLDPAANAISIATQRAAKASVSDKVAFRVGNVYDLPAGGERYDIAVLRGVLHHLPDQQAALDSVAAVADEIVIMEPNGWNPVLKIIEKLSPYHRAHEEQSFLPSTIDQWLRRAGKRPVGGRLINLVPLFCPDGPARLLKRLEPIVEAAPIIRMFGCGQYIVRGV